MHSEFETNGIHRRATLSPSQFTRTRSHHGVTMKYPKSAKFYCYHENLAMWAYDGYRYAPPTRGQTAEEYEKVRVEGVRCARATVELTCYAQDILMWLQKGGSSFMTLPGPHNGDPRDRTTDGWPPIPEHPMEYMGDRPATDECRANYRTYLLKWDS